MREEIEMKINDLISLTGFNGNRSAWTEKILALYSDVSKISTSQSFPRVSRITRVVQYSQIDSIGVSGDEKGLYWYQWYDWYQWKSILFQWFCW